MLPVLLLAPVTNAATAGAAPEERATSRALVNCEWYGTLSLVETNDGSAAGEGWTWSNHTIERTTFVSEPVDAIDQPGKCVATWTKSYEGRFLDTHACFIPPGATQYLNIVTEGSASSGGSMTASVHDWGGGTWGLEAYAYGGSLATTRKHEAQSCQGEVSEWSDAGTTIPAGLASPNAECREALRVAGPTAQEEAGSCTLVREGGDSRGESTWTWSFRRVPPPPVEMVTLTVLFDGPGRVVGGPTECQAYDASYAGVCVWQVPRGSEVHLTASELTPGTYQSWVGCDVVDGRACIATMVADRTVTVRFDPVRSYAPRAYFHPDEAIGAMDPDDFFARSSLYWYRTSCKSFNSTVGRREIASAKELTIRSLRAGKHQYRYCGRWYKSSQLTAPAERDNRAKRPRNSRAGFYLQVPSKKKFYEGVPVGSSGRYNGPPMHYERRRNSIVYWFFFGYNNRLGDKHQGDWEHMAVRLNERKLASYGAYYNHYCDADVRHWSSLEVEESMHPVAYIARGGHGIWPTAGSTKLSTCANLPSYDIFKGFWDVRAKGSHWDTWSGALVDTTTNGWYAAGVGWGREGGIGWGPLGPGPHKKKVVPDGW